MAVTKSLQPSLASIATNDVVNYNGTKDTVSAVVSTAIVHSYNQAVVTLTTAGINITLSDWDTVQSGYHEDSDGSFHAVWVQTATH